MCYELCGPDYKDPADVEAYYAWQDAEWAEDDEDETEEVEELSENEADDKFQDYMNELNPVVSIAGIDYDPARVLKEVDPISYRQEFLNWVDSETQDGRYSFPWNE